jgi:hypothetical protein
MAAAKNRMALRPLTIKIMTIRQAPKWQYVTRTVTYS